MENSELIEQKVLQEFSMSEETELLNLTQFHAIKLAATLADARAAIASGEGMLQWDLEQLHKLITRTAVVLEVLQLRWPECKVHREEFVDAIRECLE